MLGVGVVCEGMPPCFEQQLYSQQSRHPRLATGGMLQRIWMLGTLPGMANECPPVLGGGGVVQMCVVWVMLHRSLAANKEAFTFFCFAGRFCCPNCCLRRWSYVDVGVNEASLLTGAEWLTLCSEAVIPGRRTGVVCPYWLAEQHQHEAQPPQGQVWKLLVMMYE